MHLIIGIYLWLQSSSLYGSDKLDEASPSLCERNCNYIDDCDKRVVSL